MAIEGFLKITVNIMGLDQDLFTSQNAASPVLNMTVSVFLSSLCVAGSTISVITDVTDDDEAEHKPSSFLIAVLAMNKNNLLLLENVQEADKHCKKIPFLHSIFSDRTCTLTSKEIFHLKDVKVI